MDLFSQSVIFILLLSGSGLIIQSVLKKRGMLIARALFLVLLGFILLYVPFFFGGSLMIRYFDRILPGDEFTECFGFFMENLFEGPFMLMRTASVISAVFAIFILTATAIVAVRVITNIVLFVGSKTVKFLFHPTREIN